MPQKPKFRLTARNREILRVIESAKDEPTNFLWNVVDGERTRFPIQVKAIDFEKNRIDLALIERFQGLSEGQNVYLKLGTHDAAFKAKLALKIGAKVSITFPDELVMPENRGLERHSFYPTEGKRVTIKLGGKAVQEELSVYDISAKGICVFVIERDQDAFPLQTFLKVEALGSSRLPRAISGRVTSRAPVVGGYRIGVHLDDTIPDSAFEQFILRKDFSINHTQIVRDEEFRERVKKNAARVKKSLSTRKTFRDLFETYERSDSNCQYMKHHVHMLCDVMSGLGTRLKWVHEDAIDKLIYVAYLHDVRFSRCPKVAKISSKREFELLQDGLTDAEQKAFLEAPSYAAELAKEDLSAYPDAVKILLQQKELPDGSGYPYGISGTAFTPLTCLFIVSHLFVDYVLRYNDWSVDDFIRSNRHRLQGEYFNKVFQMMAQN